MPTYIMKPSFLVWCWWISQPFLASFGPLLQLFFSSSVPLHLTLNSIQLSYGQNWTLNIFQTHGITCKFRDFALAAMACSHLQDSQSYTYSERPGEEISGQMMPSQSPSCPLVPSLPSSSSSHKASSLPLPSHFCTLLILLLFSLSRYLKSNQLPP